MVSRLQESLRKEGFNARGEPVSPSFRKWTDEDTQELIYRYTVKLESRTNLAYGFRRTETAIKRKLEHLGIRRPHGEKIER